MPNREELRRWLSSEAAEHDDAADAAFAQLFSSLPRVEPGAAFVDRTIGAVWRARARRRRVQTGAWAAAAIVTVASALAAYWTMPGAGVWAIKAFANATGHTVPWLIAYTRAALDSWWTLGRVGGSVAAAIATPTHAAALVCVEVIGILAFFALVRLVRAERLGDGHA